MSNRAWERRRTKRGLAARQLDAISRAMRRDRGKPLPRTWTSKGTGLMVSVTLGEPADEPDLDEDLDPWGEVDRFLDHPHDMALGIDQARWVPEVNDPVEQELARWP